jgi:hypothetical protein
LLRELRLIEDVIPFFVIADVAAKSFYAGYRIHTYLSRETT